MVKVGKRIVLKRAMGFGEPKIFKEAMQNYRRLKRIGVPVTEFKGKIRRRKRGPVRELIFAYAQPISRAQVTGNINKIVDIVLKASNSRYSICPQLDSFGVSKGKLVLFDWYPSKVCKTKREALRRNILSLLDSTAATFNLNNYARIEQKIMKRLAARGIGKEALD